MSGNLFGKIFCVLTFGESHGPAIGLVIDGVQPGLMLDLQQVQQELDRRRPGQSRLTSARRESDRLQVISGVKDGRTTGTPLCLLIANQDQRPGDYRDLERVLRPGHAGYAFLQKYGIFDHQGGGRASGRETAARVAAGAVARQFLQQRGIGIVGFTRRVGNISARKTDFDQIERNSVRAPDARAARRMEAAILRAQAEGDSLGGVVEVVVQNCPAGLGEPVFHKLQADFAGALMSIGAVKGFEMGSGFAAAGQKGSEHNDPFFFDPESRHIRMRTNNAGGVLGGISSGQDLVMRIAVKPPSSIGKPQETVDLQGNPVQLETGGRHDPCICPRIVPVAEAMVALVLLDHLLLQERISSETETEQRREKLATIDLQILLLLARRRRLRADVLPGDRQRLEEAAAVLALPSATLDWLLEQTGSGSEQNSE